MAGLLKRIGNAILGGGGGVEAQPTSQPIIDPKKEAAGIDFARKRLEQQGQDYTMNAIAAMPDRAAPAVRNALRKIAEERIDNDPNIITVVPTDVTETKQK